MLTTYKISYYHTVNLTEILNYLDLLGQLVLI
jgi:hypothetical protein